jgi:ferritin heavy chain
MNLHDDCEAAINKQANMEMYASMAYLSMANYFARDDVALDGFSRFCWAQYEEEQGHAQLFWKVQTQRGGRVVLHNIAKPPREEWGTPLEAMEAALELERNNNQCLLDVHALAHKHHDGHLSNYIEDQLLDEQVESLKEISDIVTNLRRLGKGVGEYLYDKEMAEKAEEKEKEVEELKKRVAFSS